MPQQPTPKVTDITGSSATSGPSTTLASDQTTSGRSGTTPGNSKRTILERISRARSKSSANDATPTPSDIDEASGSELIKTRSQSSSHTSEENETSTGTAMEKFQLSLVDIEPEITCPICHCLFNDPTTIVDCLHNFCSGCIQAWFNERSSAVCPMCRVPVRALRSNPIVKSLLSKALKAKEAAGVPSENASLNESSSINNSLWIECDNCQEQMEYEVHYHCAGCEGGNYDICRDCYTEGIRCKTEGKPSLINHHERPFEQGWQMRRWSRETGEVQIGLFCSNRDCQTTTNKSWFYSCSQCKPNPPLPPLQKEGYRSILDTQNAQAQDSLVIKNVLYCHECIITGIHCQHPLEKCELLLPKHDPSFSMIKGTPFSYSKENFGWHAQPTYFAEYSKCRTFFYCDSCGGEIKKPDADTPTERLYCGGVRYFHCTQCLDSDFDLCEPCYMRIMNISSTKDLDVMLLSLSDRPGARKELKCSAGHDISMMMVTSKGKRMRLSPGPL